MKTIKLLSISLVISSALLFSSCKKAEGCTNPKASNYDSKAKVYDESCIYSTEIVFWFKEDASQALQGTEIYQLAFFLNDEPLGNSNTDIFWTEAPACDDGGTIKFTKELEKASYEPFYYSVKDKDGFEIWKGITQLDTDSCRVIHLKY